MVKHQFSLLYYGWTFQHQLMPLINFHPGHVKLDLIKCFTTSDDWVFQYIKGIKNAYKLRPLQPLCPGPNKDINKIGEVNRWLTSGFLISLNSVQISPLVNQSINQIFPLSINFLTVIIKSPTWCHSVSSLVWTTDPNTKKVILLAHTVI